MLEATGEGEAVQARGDGDVWSVLVEPWTPDRASAERGEGEPKSEADGTTDCTSGDHGLAPLRLTTQRLEVRVGSAGTLLEFAARDTLQLEAARHDAEADDTSPGEQ